MIERGTNLTDKPRGEISDSARRMQLRPGSEETRAGEQAERDQDVLYHCDFVRGARIIRAGRRYYVRIRARARPFHKYS